MEDESEMQIAPHSKRQRFYYKLLIPLEEFCVPRALKTEVNRVGYQGRVVLLGGLLIQQSAAINNKGLNRVTPGGSIEGTRML